MNYSKQPSGWNWTVLEKGLALVASVIAWSVWAFFLFVVMVILVLGSGIHIGREAWTFVLLVAAIPLACLLAVCLWRAQSHRLIPQTTYGRWMAAVQVVGALAIVGALVAPLTILRPQLDPTVGISVTNTAEYATRFTVADDNYPYGCSDYVVVEPGRSAKARLNLGRKGMFECLGSIEFRTLEIRNAVGVWLCDWDEAKELQPIVITDDGPVCGVTSFVPADPEPQFPLNSPPFADPPVPVP